jgi:hypothetical protein
VGAVGSQDVQVSGDQIPRVGSRQAEEGAVGGARCQAGSIGQQQWRMMCEEFCWRMFAGSKRDWAGRQRQRGV